MVKLNFSMTRLLQYWSKTLTKFWNVIKTHPVCTPLDPFTPCNNKLKDIIHPKKEKSSKKAQ